MEDMGCIEVLDRIEEYQAGRLAGAQAAALAGHLGGCPACLETAEALRQAGALLRGLSRAGAPAGLWPALRRRVADRYAVFATPLGAVYVAYGEAGIVRVGRWVSATALEQEYARRCRRPLVADPAPPSSVVRAVERFWAGARPAELALDLHGLSPFQRAVLAKTREIPRGEVRPYAWLAKEVGRPKAVRAVGSALHDNPVPLLIPCHRVVRSDGTVGEYAWGVAAKRQLLAVEGVDPDALAAGARSGARLHGSRTTKIFCLPTCRQARRIHAEHRTAFASAAEATTAGYRPCKLCRPA